MALPAFEVAAVRALKHVTYNCNRILLPFIGRITRLLTQEIQAVPNSTKKQFAPVKSELYDTTEGCVYQYGSGVINQLIPTVLETLLSDVVYMVVRSHKMSSAGNSLNLGNETNRRQQQLTKNAGGTGSVNINQHASHTVLDDASEDDAVQLCCSALRCK
eukprot:GFYU01050133.1.p2 GENE.GFYU01050133.1~~GFYU01050133.1.p2  ORF type:complete len:160 (+),score=36.41 GFYU01050133.1:147-626(+)